MKYIIVKIPISGNVAEFDKENYQSENDFLLKGEPLSYQVIENQLVIVFEEQTKSTGDYSFV